MSEPVTDRQLPITQIDELWAIASKRWGDPGRRTPPPDPRFRELREYLGKIETLFSKDKEQKSVPIDRGFKTKRKMAIADPEDDFDEDSEIPF